MTMINYKRTGGAMGKEMAVDFNLNEMPDDTAQRLHNLILEAEFFKTPVQSTAMSRPDEYEYSITINRANVIHTVRTTDTSMPDSVRPLIEELTLLAETAEKQLIKACSTKAYKCRFGSFSASRYNTVKTNFTAISDAWDNAGVNFDCQCKQNYYAYVYPDRPYNIYLCKVFWIAPLTGTDSKAGTLIHEMSHFNVVAAADDVVYGQAGARDLADSNPDLAITNADSHEYFAENTPSLR